MVFKVYFVQTLEYVAQFECWCTQSKIKMKIQVMGKY